MDLVETAIAALEDVPIFNAGLGSNLNIDGNVECDASIYSTTNTTSNNTNNTTTNNTNNNNNNTKTPTLGCIAAAPGIKNPIKAASLLARQSNPSLYLPLSHGRVRPLILAGKGARNWARQQQGLDIDVNLKTEESIRRWKKYMSIIKEKEGGEVDDDNDDDDKKRKNSDNDDYDDGEDALWDTVGAIAAIITTTIDKDEDKEHTIHTITHDIAAGVSSGGTALKQKGRVGHAGVVGAGAWVATSPSSSLHNNIMRSAATSVSGVGEVIIRSMTARYCADRLIDGGGGGVEMIEHMMECSPAKPNDVGIISLKIVGEEVEIECCHNSVSFGVCIVEVGKEPVVMMMRGEGLEVEVEVEAGGGRKGNNGCERTTRGICRLKL
jgi:taspase (threonine aspartase 1)